MQSVIITVDCKGPGLKLPGLEEIERISNRENRYTPCYCYEQALGWFADGDVLVYFHDDVTVHDPAWRELLLAPFQINEDVVAVGMGGATGLGSADLYRKPFRIQNMARSGYASNQTDAEVHGERFSGHRRVVVLDAFCMAVRREFLVACGGWPTANLTHHCLDLWLACEAARRDKETWMAGISCTHHGGGTSTNPAYAKADWLQGGELTEDHIRPHLWLYNEYRDVLPILVGEK